MTRPILADAFEHHVWATVRLIDACRGLSTDQLTTEVPGIYGAILPTIRHTVGADCSYLALLSNGAVVEIDEGQLGPDELRAVMQANGPVWAELVAGDLDVEIQVVRHREDGSESGAPLGVRLAQALHHGSDHRSQVCTALTVLGVEPPKIDVWDHTLDGGRLTETGPALTDDG